MKKNPLPGNCLPKFQWLTQISKTMQLSTILLLCGFITAYANDSFSQNARVSINKYNVLLEDVLTEIENQTDYLFIYNNQLNLKHKVSVKEKNRRVAEVLPKVFKDLNIDFALEGSHIILKENTPDKISSSETQQQTRRITGSVKDGLGDPVAGATIVVKGTTNGVITDLNGNFNLEAGDNDILVISFIGFNSQEILVGSNQVINIVLKESLLSLEEVVVVGYGVQSRVSITGSVSTTKGDDILKSQTPNVVNSITGHIPGMIINSRSGEPGKENPEIFIRGRSTTGSSDPLIIIDGIARTDLSRINPNDIESISVLKDASAAIYGSRAANGVILVTTKRGQKGAPVFNLTYNQGFSQPTRNPKMADSYTFAKVYNEIEIGDGREAKYSATEIEKFRIGKEEGYTTTDWFDTMTKTLTPQHQVNLSVSGGGDALDYYLSIGKMGQDGHFEYGTTKVNRYNFRSNVTVKATDYIKVGLDVSGRLDDKHYPTNPDTRGIYSHLYLYEPSWTLFWPGTKYLRPNRGGENLVNWVSNNGGSQDDTYKALETKLHFNIDIPWVKGLSVNGSANYDAGYNFIKYFKKPSFVYTREDDAYTKIRSGDSPELARLEEYFDQMTTVTINTMVNYTTTIANHKIGVMAGYEQMEYDDNFFEAGLTDFPSPALPEFFAGSSDPTKRSLGGSASKTSRQNYFGRATYDYSGKYLAEFIFRYDGSPIFPENKRWGFFPGFSLGWRISEESFMNDFSFLDNLKIRASYGEMGNDAVPAYQYLTTYGYKNASGNAYGYVIGNKDVLGVGQSVAPNPFITWEVAKTTNIGIDASLWAGLLGVEFDLFKTRRSNILTPRTAVVPDYTGLSLPDENYGIVENKGFDLQLSHRKRISNKLSYSLVGNLSFARNKVIITNEAPAAEKYQVAKGKPIGSELFYQAIGIYSSQDQINATPHMLGAKPGDIIYKDVNKDGEINSRDQVRNKFTPTPEIVYSFNASVNYRNIDFSIMFQGQENAETYVKEGGVDNPQPYFAVMSYNLGNFLEWRGNDRWSPENTNASQPRASLSNFNNNTLPSTHWLLDAGFLRLKNVEIGYSVPSSLCQKMGVSGLRAYVSANNLFIIYDHMKDLGFDPETSDFWYYPQQRTFNFGFNLTF